MGGEAEGKMHGLQSMIIRGGEQVGGGGGGEGQGG